MSLHRRSKLAHRGHAVNKEGLAAILDSWPNLNFVKFPWHDGSWSDVKAAADARLADMTDVCKMICAINPTRLRHGAVSTMFDNYFTNINSAFSREDVAKRIFPKIRTYLLDGPGLFSAEPLIPFLTSEKSANITFSREQVRCLVAAMFFDLMSDSGVGVALHYSKNINSALDRTPNDKAKQKLLEDIDNGPLSRALVSSANLFKNSSVYLLHCLLSYFDEDLVPGNVIIHRETPGRLAPPNYQFGGLAGEAGVTTMKKKGSGGLDRSYSTALCGGGQGGGHSGSHSSQDDDQGGDGGYECPRIKYISSRIGDSFGQVFSGEVETLIRYPEVWAAAVVCSELGPGEIIVCSGVVKYYAKPIQYSPLIPKIMKPPRVLALINFHNAGSRKTQYSEKVFTHDFEKFYYAFALLPAKHFIVGTRGPQTSVYNPELRFLQAVLAARMTGKGLIYSTDFAGEEAVNESFMKSLETSRVDEIIGAVEDIPQDVADGHIPAMDVDTKNIFDLLWS